LAGARHISDLAKVSDPDFPYEFDEAKGNKICKFLELLPYAGGGGGVTQGDLLKLQPWQKFILASIFGWVKKSTGYRRFTTAYCCIPRKNGKSQMAAGVGLYMLCMDGEFGAQVYSGANNEKQANFVFEPAQFMADQTPEFCKRYGVKVNASSITQLKTNSFFRRLIGKPKDGGGSNLTILDEWHQAPDAILYDTMMTGMVARKQPLMFIITTAGSDTTGPCHPFQQNVEKTLEGALDNPDWFGIVYGIDEGDDWATEEALIKANPNWGVAIEPEKMLAAQRVAIQSPEKQNDFKTKHLNIWCTATSTWLNVERWKSLVDPALDEHQFDGQPCVLGLDLASQVDMAAAVKVFQKEIDGQMHYYVFPRFYLPEERALLAQFQHYQKWVHDKDVVATPGSAIDFSYIKRDIILDCAHYDVKEACFDKYQGVDLSQQIAAETGIETVEIPQNVGTLSEPSKWLEALITSGRIHHTGHPILQWNVGNVVVREDVNSNIFPHKDPKRPNNKIDGVSALLNCLVRTKAALGETDGGYHVYSGL
jgi:phage terminase large subunit-like protein